MIKDDSKYTLKELTAEYIKCKNDPDYFISNYIEVESPGGNSKLKTYAPQKKFLNSAVNDHHIIVLKSRQTGISTIMQAYVAWVVTFFSNVVIGVVSRDGPESTSFCKTIIGMIETIPEWIRPKFKKCAEQQFQTNNGCKFYASQISPSNPGKLFRGRALTIAILDEAAFAERIEVAFAGFGPTLVKSQKTAKDRNIPYGTFIVSTPNKTTGIGKWYYDTWVQANNGTAIYKPIKIHWSEVDDFKNDPSWYQTQCSILKNDPVLISQELEMKFLAGSDSFLSPSTIEKLNEIDEKPQFKIPINGKYTIDIFKEYMRGKYYLIGIDTATSRPGDFSAIEVVDYETFEQVAEYWGNSRVDDYCKILSEVIKLYPNCLIIPENNSIGNQVVEYLTRDAMISQEKIYKEKLKSSTISNEFIKNANDKFRYGLSTNSRTRPLMIDALYTYITENPNMVKSKSLALDLIGLCKKNGSDRVEASTGSHDDLSLALAFCCYVRKYDCPKMFDIFSNNENCNSINRLNEDLSSITKIDEYDAIQKPVPNINIDNLKNNDQLKNVLIALNSLFTK